MKAGSTKATTHRKSGSSSVIPSDSTPRGKRRGNAERQRGRHSQHAEDAPQLYMDAHGSHGQQHHAQHQRRETERVVRNPRMGFHEEKEHAQHHADHKKPKVRVLVEYLDLPEAECEEQAHARADEQKRHDGGELEAGYPGTCPGKKKPSRNSGTANVL